MAHTAVAPASPVVSIRARPSSSRRLGAGALGRKSPGRKSPAQPRCAPKRAAPRALLQAATHLLRLKERVFGSRAPITSEILRMAPLYMWYSSDKADRELDWRAGSVDAGIESAWRQLRAT